MLLLFLVGLVAVVGLTVTAAVGTDLAALSSLLAAPGQLRLLLRGRGARRNLALAHATVNVLRQRHGQSGLVALVHPEGFVIRGGAHPSQVADAASEALARLRAGERGLAVNPRSAVILLATEVTLGLALLVALLLTDTFGLLTLLAGLILIALVGPRFSPILQRRLAAGSRLEALSVGDVQLESASGVRGLLTLMTMGPVLVRTSRATVGAAGGRTPYSASPNGRNEIGVEDYRVR
ncbi:MAG TPA: DUF6391 domain-containing protein [Thermomicrobiaceae bacterium]|nr:DUF6391 domain-containing protein [Thermomicrobiaceae bacterium]